MDAFSQRIRQSGSLVAFVVACIATLVGGCGSIVYAHSSRTPSCTGTHNNGSVIVGSDSASSVWAEVFAVLSFVGGFALMFIMDETKERAKQGLWSRLSRWLACCRNVQVHAPANVSNLNKLLRLVDEGNRLQAHYNQVLAAGLAGLARNRHEQLLLLQAQPGLHQHVQQQYPGHFNSMISQSTIQLAPVQAGAAPPAAAPAAAAAAAAQLPQGQAPSTQATA